MTNQPSHVLEGVGSCHAVPLVHHLLDPICESTVLSPTEPFVESQFYQTQEGLYVSKTFLDRVNLSSTVDLTPERLYMVSHLKAKSTSEDIMKELPENHIATRKEIASFIKAQPRGQSGFLQRNGCPNIFFCLDKNDKKFIVRVWRIPFYEEWGVDDWNIGDSKDWDAMCRVFYPCPADI